MGDAELPAPYSSAWLIAHAAFTRPMWLNACGKLPSSSPVSASTSSASSPTSLTKAIARSNVSRARSDLAGERERLREPERAEEERALFAFEAVVREVAVDEPVLVGEPLRGGVDRREHAGIVGGEEADDRHHQVRRVELVGAERLGERAGRRRSSRA